MAATTWKQSGMNRAATAESQDRTAFLSFTSLDREAAHTVLAGPAGLFVGRGP